MQPMKLNCSHFATEHLGLVDIQLPDNKMYQKMAFTDGKLNF